MAYFSLFPRTGGVERKFLESFQDVSPLIIAIRCRLEVVLRLSILNCKNNIIEREKSKMRSKLMMLVVVGLLVVGSVSADTFGSGENQFTIDFVDISGDAGDLGSWPAGDDYPSGNDYIFSGVNHGDYRIGTYEITNDQWNKFQNEYGTVTGSPLDAYDASAYWTGTNVPTSKLSWYEGAQFVNYLNTDAGYDPAYKFTGTQGTGDYTLGVWGTGDSGYDASNPYRNSNAYYFMPTEDEWVKAAYWNGTNLQTYATTDNSTPTVGVDSNFYNAFQPWDIGSGSEELNGTYDMMGNVVEWMENPYSENPLHPLQGGYSSGSHRSFRGGSCNQNDYHYLSSSCRFYANPDGEGALMGFRVASVPEPASIALLSLGGMILRRRKS